MQMKLFGWSFGRKSSQMQNAPVSPEPQETSLDLQNVPGFISPAAPFYNDSANNAITENDYINKYREISQIPEVDLAVEEIIAETIIHDQEGGQTLSLNLDNLDVSDQIKEVISEEFEGVLDLLNFRSRGHDITKRWYIDGRINYYGLIDEGNPRNGIVELRYIDPRKIKKVREINKKVDADTSVASISDVKEYYLYNEQGITNLLNTAGSVTIAPDSIVHCNSGLYEPTTNIFIGHLHKALRVANNMVMMEQAMLIYKLSRAPERRIFYIDTGTLPKAKAEQYVQQISDKFRTKVVYDANTGEIKNDKRYLAMTEDFWIPLREGSAGTRIETLEGGAQSGEVGEAEYFKGKLYMALNVPASRFDAQPSIFSSGTEITRDELRFSRFIQRLRERFNVLFLEILKRQLVLKGVLLEQDWELIKNRVVIVYNEDNYFSEAMKSTILQGRLSVLQQADQFVGKYLSRDWVYKNVFYMTDAERKEQEQKLLSEDIEFNESLMQSDPTQQVVESIKPLSEDDEDEREDDEEKEPEELTESEIALNEAAAEMLRSISKK